MKIAAVQLFLAQSIEKMAAIEAVHWIPPVISFVIMVTFGLILAKIMIKRFEGVETETKAQSIVINNLPHFFRRVEKTESDCDRNSMAIQAVIADMRDCMNRREYVESERESKSAMYREINRIDKDVEVLKDRSREGRWNDK